MRSSFCLFTEDPKLLWLGTTTDMGTSYFLGVPDYICMHAPKCTQEEYTAALPSFTQAKEVAEKHKP